MAARRCSLCGISYPNQARFMKCPVHDEPTDYSSDLVPDENWEWAATALMTRAKEAAIEHEGVTILPLEPEPLPGGLYALDSRDVIRANARLAVGEVFEIPGEPVGPRDAPCNCLWEVVGYHYGERKWIISPLRVPDYVPAA